MPIEVNQIVSFVFQDETKMAQSLGYKSEDLYKVAYVKSNKSFHVLVDPAIGEFVAIGGTSGSGGASVMAYPYTDVGMRNAVSLCQAAGGGTVVYANARYAVAAEVPDVNFVSHEGFPAQVSHQGPPPVEVPDATFYFTGGTILDIATGVTCFTHNAIPLVDQPINLAQLGLSSSHKKNLAFVGGKGAIHHGDFRNPGPYWCNYEKLYFMNQTDFHFKVENFQHCNFTDFRSINQLNSAGGYHYYMSVEDSAGPTGLLPGNSDWRGEHYSISTGRFAKNYYWLARGTANCQMNELAVNARMQANRYGGAAVDEVFTLVGGTSPNMIINNPANINNYPVGMPFRFTSGTPNWVPAGAVFWVNTNNGVDTITVSLTPEPAAGYAGLGFTSSGPFTIKSSGFPAVMIHAGTGSLINNSHFGDNWDVEAAGNVTAISFSRVFNSTLGLHEVMPSATDSLITARSSSVEISCRGTSHVTTDFDDFINNVRTKIVNKTAGFRYYTTDLTLGREHHNCRIHIDSATAKVVTVPDLKLFGFDCEIIQSGVGQVTVGTATNVKSFAGLKTAGQYATARLAGSKRTEYILSGQTAV